MHYRRLLGIGLTVTALAGYVAGVYAPYPGRAFSLTFGMLGIALALTTPTEEGST